MEQKDLSDILRPHADRFEMSTVLGLLLLALLVTESAVAWLITRSNVASPAARHLLRSHEPEAVPV